MASELDRAPQGALTLQCPGSMFTPIKRGVGNSSRIKHNSNRTKYKQHFTKQPNNMATSSHQTPAPAVRNKRASGRLRRARLPPDTGPVLVGLQSPVMPLCVAACLCIRQGGQQRASWRAIHHRHVLPGRRDWERQRLKHSEAEAGPQQLPQHDAGPDWNGSSISNAARSA